MKNEKLSKTVYSNIPNPHIMLKEKNKDNNNKIDKNKNKSKDKDKNILKQKIDNTSNNKNNKKNNSLKKDDLMMVKHKTASNVNNSYKNKNPTLLIKRRKSSKLKVSKLNITNNKNGNKIQTSQINKNYHNSYIKASFSNNDYNKKNKNENNIYNNTIYFFIKNKINYHIKKLSYDFKYKNINSFLYNEKIIHNDKRNNSSPFLLYNFNNKNIIPKRFNKKRFMTQKVLKKEIFKKINNKSLLINQKNIKNKNKKNNKEIGFSSSFVNNNNKSISNTKTEDKPLSNIKKKIYLYSSKLSSSKNINYYNENNSSFIKKKKETRIETEPKKENLTIIEENGKLKNKYFNNLHRYLQNTVSTKNKMVLKKQEEKKVSNFNNNNNAEKNMEEKPKSLEKRKRYSFINRNNIFKFDKISNIKDNNITHIIKSKDNSRKKIQSTEKKHKKYQIADFPLKPSNTKIFNGKIDNYLITKELGKGSYASVKLAINKTNKNKYAIKLYERETLIDPQKKSTIKNEINILKQLDNINVMKLYEVIDTPKYLYLVMEYINGVSLLETIKQDQNHYFEEKRAIKIFIQIVKGILYCQSKNICHRDIKLENILLIKDDIVKIIDFGFAVKATKESYQKLFCGTPSYMAPEIVNKEKYIAQYSDIWSLGVLFFAMLYGRFPFRAKTQEDLFDIINEANVVFPDDIEISEEIKDLIRKIFVVNPTQRISLNEIINELSNFINN